VTEEIKKGSPAKDLARLEVSAENYLQGVDRDMVEESHIAGSLLADEEKEAVELLASIGFEYVSHDKNFMAFRPLRDSNFRLPPSSGRLLPRAYVRTLLGQLGEKVEKHPAVSGLIVPSQGYAELICSRFSPIVAKRAFRLKMNELDCIHKDQARALPSLPYRWPDEHGESITRAHLSGHDDEPCVEISNASPLALLYYDHIFEGSRLRLGSRRIPFLATLKIAYRAAFDRDRLGRKSEDTARSLLYELNVRNGIVVELDAPPAGLDTAVARRPPEVSDRIRYPRTKVQPEVSILFGFASQASGDPPQVFLSYYQALEYFIPTAIRRSAITSIRRELRDPGFDDTNDASVLRIVKAAEGPIVAAEPNQLRIVVNEYVRSSRLEEFFEYGWGDYFSHKGPIKGVTPINIRNSQSLSDQVADRVYQIRNRIVHAKDDRRFGDARVLLPRSTESNALAPDVMLVRLLATEAISAGQ
jgi:hypothetical protein